MDMMLIQVINFDESPNISGGMLIQVLNFDESPESPNRSGSAH